MCCSPECLLCPECSRLQIWLFTSCHLLQTLLHSLSLPITLYGCELLSISKTESLMLERVHQKTLRTIQGLPIRCPSLALTSLLGYRDISSLISQQQLSFINSITSMSTTDLPRLILEQRLSNLSLAGIIPRWQQLLDNLKPPISSTGDLPPKKQSLLEKLYRKDAEH